MKNEFVSQRIGDPDFPRMSKTREKYEVFASDAVFVISEISHMQNDIPATVDQVLEFIQSKDPLRWLTFLYIEANGTKFPGLITEKLVDNKLVQIPDGDVEQALNSHKMITDDIQQIIKSEFLFPLVKLWGPHYKVPEENCFRITPEFEETLEKHCSTYTRNEKQNLLIPVMEDLINAVNKLHQMQLINLAHGISDLHKIFILIDTKRTGDNPAIVNKKRIQYAFKENGDSYNVPNWSAPDLFENSSSVTDMSIPED
jgi:hypothetical protein